MDQAFPKPLRLDVFLKFSCIVPRRTVAKSFCDEGFALLNGRVAKASSLVAAGDILELVVGPRRRTYRILKLPVGQVSKKTAPALYTLTGQSVVQDVSDTPGLIGHKP